MLAPLLTTLCAWRIPRIASRCPGPGLSSVNRVIIACESGKTLKWASGVASWAHSSIARANAEVSASKADAPPLRVHASATAPPSHLYLTNDLLFSREVLSPLLLPFLPILPVSRGLLAMVPILSTSTLSAVRGSLSFRSWSTKYVTTAPAATPPG